MTPQTNELGQNAPEAPRAIVPDTTPEAPDDTTGEGLSFDSLPLLVELPEAPASVETPSPHPAPEYAAPLDEFARDEFGQVKMCADGITPQKKRGRKGGAGDKNAPYSGPSNPRPEKVSQQIAQIPATSDQQIAATSGALIHMATGILSGVLGAEWALEDKAEFKTLDDPLQTYLRARNIVDVPPGVILCIALAGYGAKRLQHQNTRTKLGFITFKIKGFFSGALSRLRGE